MPDTQQEPSKLSPIAAIEANMFASFATWRSWSRVEVHDEPEWLWTISDIPFGLYNIVMRANLTPDRADDAIEAAIERCRSRNVPMMWLTGPATRPADLGARLAAHGFVGAEPLGMALYLDDWSERPTRPDGLVIEQVTDLDALAQFSRVTYQGLEWPALAGEAMLDALRSEGVTPGLPLRHFLGRLDGEPVTISSVFLHGGVAGIYNVATVPAARRRGFGTAMTAAALREAKAERCDLAILQASEMGAGIYRSLGFQEYCKLGFYSWGE